MADEVQIDKLSIEVEAESSSAVREIDTLAESLENLAKNSRLSETIANLNKLKSALSGMDSAQKYTKQMQKMSRSLQDLEGKSQIDLSLKGADQANQQLDTLAKNIEKSVGQLLGPQSDIFEKAMGKLGVQRAKQPMFDVKSYKYVSPAEKNVRVLNELNAELERAVNFYEEIEGLSKKALLEPDGYIKNGGMNFAELAKNYQQPLEKDQQDQDYPLAEGFDKYSESAQRAGEAAYEAYKKIKEAAAEAVPKIQEVQIEQSKLTDSASTVGKPYQGYVDSVEQLRQSIQEATGEVDWYKNAIRGAFMNGDDAALKELKADLKEAQIYLKGLNDELKASESASSGMNWKGVSSGLTAVKQVASSVVGTLKTYLSGIKKLGSYIGGGFIKNLESGIQKITKFGKSVQRMAMLRVTWSVIKAISSGYQEGIDNLYQYAVIQGVQFQHTMDNMASSSLYFKNAIGAAAGVLYNTFLPVLSAIADAAANVANALARMFAFLAGASTYQAAVKGVTSYQEAASGAASSTKELQKYLLGIDELNVLPDNTPSGGGGGATTPDYSQMFETLNTGIDDLKSILEGPDWYELGVMFAEKLNDAMANIPWDKIQATTQLWATRIYTFLNGAVDALDWNLVGVTLSQGLNTALGFMDTIVQGFHWDTLGQEIGTALQGLQDSVDWKLIGRTWTNGLKALFETLHGFMESDFSFEDLRENVNKAIGSAFKNINMNEAASDLGNFALEVLKTIKSALSNVPWKEIGNALKQIPWASIMGKALGILWEITKGLVETDLDTVVFPFLGAKLGGGIGTAIGGLLGGPVGAVIGTAVGTLMGGIAGLFTSFLPNILSAFDEGSLKLAEILAGMVIGIVDFGSKGVEAFNNFSNTAGNFLGDFATNAYNKISGFATSTYNTILGWNQSVSEKIADFATNAYNKIFTWASNTGNKFSSWKNETFNKINAWASETQAKISGWSQNALSTISGWVGNAVNSFNGFKNDAINALNNAFNGIQNVISDMISRAWSWGSDFIQNIIDGISAAKDKLISTVKSVADGIAAFMHFSVPDKGPLADADTWMPDMMALFSEGIRANVGEVTGNIQKVAHAMQDVMTGTAYVDSNALTGANNYVGAVSAARYGTTQYPQSYSSSDNQQNDKELVLIMRQMLALMQQGSETKVVIDGREIFSTVKAQARREQMRTGVNPLL